MQFIDSEQRYSDAVIVSDWIFLSGQVPEDEHADIRAQTASVLNQIEALLQRCGSSKAHIMEATVYLRDMADLAAMNAVWDAWTVPGRAPARACVQALLANPNWRVEIKLSALRQEALPQTSI